MDQLQRLVRMFSMDNHDTAYHDPSVHPAEGIEESALLSARLARLSSNASRTQRRIESCLFQATSLGQRAKEAEDKNELLERERNDLAEEVRRLQAMNKEYEAREEALKKENNSLKDQLLVISRIPEAAGELLRLMASAGSQRINGHLGEINVSDDLVEGLGARVQELGRLARQASIDD